MTMMLPLTTRFIVLEWTEAGASPTVADPTLYSSLYDADDAVHQLSVAAKGDGRSVTYSAHAVNMEAAAW
jgi:hypothetical protein